MELLFRIAAAALLGCGAALLMKRGAPALVLPLSVAVCAFAAFAAAAALEPVLEVMGRARKLSGVSPAWFAPVVKCVAIGVIAKAAADLCRDGGQTAMAGAVELGGAAAAFYVSLPLLETLLDLLEGLL